LRHSAWNLSSTTASADWSIGQEVTTNYDDASRLTSVVTNGGATTVSFGYDVANRQTSEEQTVAGFPTRRVQTERDADGNRMDLFVPGIYLIHFDYTWRNQLLNINQASGSPFVHFTYDSAGNMTKRQGVWGGVNDSTNVAYDELNRPTMWENTGAGDVFFARSWYKHDNLGREVATWRDEDASKGEWFRYDSTGQIVMARYNAEQVWTGSPLNWNRWVDYAYTDGSLNRYCVNDNGDARFYGAAGTNQYTGIWGSSLAYDGNFNLIWRDGVSFSFDAQNRLTNASGPSGNMQFTYDGLGRCVRRTVGGVTRLFTYDGWKPILELDGSGNPKKWNIYGAGPDEILLQVDDTGTLTRYHSDRHGNVTFLLDDGGNLIERYTYDVFGQPTILSASNTQLSTSAFGNRFMFQGREWISELNIYDFRNRYYQPQLGRFLQGDPLGFGGGDANLFRYCGGDPVNRSDPMGLQDPNAIKKTETGQEATTETVNVTGNAPDFGGTNNTLGWRDVNSLGGLDNLSQGGGLSSSGGGGSTFISRLPPLSRDSSGKGTVPKAPLSTQGYWTGPTGLPTGPNIYLLTDAWLEEVLSQVYDRVSQFESGDHWEITWAKFMLFLDTEFYNSNAYVYEGRYENLRGQWIGFQVNYVGVGEGFAGHGISRSDTTEYVADWNRSQYGLSPVNPTVIGKIEWTHLGWDYFTNRKAGGG
jgi:RHS repeat-associated protein